MMQHSDPAYRITEPELGVISDERPDGIAGGQGRTGDEVNGNGRVIKWLVVAILILVVASIIATPYFSK